MLERKICKRCGDTIYSDIDYCLDCLEYLEVERLSSLNQKDFDLELAGFIANLMKDKKFTTESENKLEAFMMARFFVSPALQIICAKLSLADVPEVFYGASRKVRNYLKKVDEANNHKDWRFMSLLQMANGECEEFGICTEDCYELIADPFTLNDDDLCSKIKLNIVDQKGKVYEIEDFLGFCADDIMPYEMIGKERVDSGKVITFRVGKKVSPFLPRFSERFNTLGGFLCKDFENPYDECEMCGKGRLHFAQLDAKQFGFGEGCLQLGICKNCGDIQIRFEQT